MMLHRQSSAVAYQQSRLPEDKGLQIIFQEIAEEQARSCKCGKTD